MLHFKCNRTRPRGINDSIAKSQKNRNEMRYGAGRVNAPVFLFVYFVCFVVLVIRRWNHETHEIHETSKEAVIDYFTSRPAVHRTPRTTSF
jgi:hypothetical protein